MPEHIRALVYILAIATVVFAFARVPATAVAVEPADFRRRRNLWFALTVFSFVAGDFWIFVVLSAFVLLVTVQAEQNKIALFLALVYAVPPFSAAIPGFGFLQQLFALNTPRLLSLTVLLPAFLFLMTRPDRLRFGRLWTDRFLIGYLALNFVIALYATTFTNVLRQTVFYAFLDVFLPYYVASRSLRDLRTFRDTLMTLVVAGLVLSAIAIFENVRGWLLYSAMVGALGPVQWGFGEYMARGGRLRAHATAGHGIALGFVLAVVLSIAFYARALVASRAFRTLGIAMLVGGLVASLSRGPWIGAIAAFLVFIAAGRGAGRQLAKYAILALVAVPVLRMVPGIGDLIDLLPIIGESEQESVDYRRRLIDAAFEVIWDNPLFGGVDIYSASSIGSILVPRGQTSTEMFVDLVNTYIGTMLATGFVGLGLFLGIFASAAAGVWREIKAIPDDADERRLLGRSLLAALACIVVTLYTTSNISVIPVTCWSLVGIAAAYGRLSFRGATQGEARRAQGASASQLSGAPGAAARITR